MLDTSVLFEHPRGIPYKLSLKHLARVYLQQFVQEHQPAADHKEGHDSIEDARGMYIDRITGFDITHVFKF